MKFSIETSKKLISFAVHTSKFDEGQYALLPVIGIDTNPTGPTFYVFFGWLTREVCIAVKTK